jgi:ribosome assembly protein YihI (activator of Der GTPase)
MRDFDQSRAERQKGDRSFRIGGETFTYKASVAPEAIQDWTTFQSSTERADAHMRAARAKLAALEAKAAVPEEAKRLADDLAANADHQAQVADLTSEIAKRADELGAAQEDSDVVNLLDETIRAMIDPADHEKWARVRSIDAPDPIGIGDLSELMEWIIERVVNRPTGQPSDSSERPSHNGTQLTDVSSPPAAPVSAPLTLDSSAT